MITPLDQSDAIINAMGNAQWLMDSATHLKTRMMARKIKKILRKIHHCEYKERDHTDLDKQAHALVREMIPSLGEYINPFDALHLLMMMEQIDIINGVNLPDDCRVTTPVL